MTEVQVKEIFTKYEQIHITGVSLNGFSEYLHQEVLKNKLGMWNIFVALKYNPYYEQSQLLKHSAELADQLAMKMAELDAEFLDDDELARQKELEEADVMEP